MQTGMLPTLFAIRLRSLAKFVCAWVMHLFGMMTFYGPTVFAMCLGSSDAFV